MSIRLTELSKTYARRAVVQELTFSCPPGQVTGFLGPNGAGKSTTLRMIVGLTTPSSGHATIDGTSYRDLANPMRSVGVMLDASALHPGRTGRETCTLVARVIGASARRVDELLEQVGLAPAAGRRVRDYSLGMRQRLGIAVSLLGEPGTLVLDEPINGLDPSGVAWLRSLLRGFADAGGTVLLSSHVLSEMQAIADRLVIIERGRLVAAGAMSELLPKASGVRLRCMNPPVLRAALEADGLTWHEGPDELFVIADADAERVARLLARSAVAVTEMGLAEPGQSLEATFMALTTQGDLR